MILCVFWPDWAPEKTAYIRIFESGAQLLAAYPEFPQCVAEFERVAAAEPGLLGFVLHDAQTGSAMKLYSALPYAIADAFEHGFVVADIG